MENLEQNFESKNAEKFEAMLATLEFLIEEKNWQGAKKLWEKVLDFGSNEDFLVYLRQEENKDLLKLFSQLQTKIEEQKKSSGLDSLKSAIEILKSQEN